MRIKSGRNRSAPANSKEKASWLESTLSQVLRIGPRQTMKVRHFPAALDEFYQEHVTGK
jgi:hypothetical protein